MSSNLYLTVCIDKATNMPRTRASVSSDLEHDIYTYSTDKLRDHLHYATHKELVDACLAALDCDNNDAIGLIVEHFEKIGEKERSYLVAYVVMERDTRVANKIVDLLDVDALSSYRACLVALQCVDESNRVEKRVPVLKKALLYACQ